MNDRELLEMAAKAAGIDVTFEHGSPQCIDMFRGHLPNYEDWNPLTDDGDALRLAVKLGLDINVYPSSKEVGAVKHHQSAKYSRYFSEVINDDWLSATRRAITIAAAEIGKAIP